MFEQEFPSSHLILFVAAWQMGSTAIPLMGKWHFLELREMMKKKIVNIVLAGARYVLRTKKYNKFFKGEINKVNLGCGLHCRFGWINVDGSLTSLLGTQITSLNKMLFKMAGSSSFYTFEEYNDIVKNKKLWWFNLTEGSPFDSDTVDVVFTSHFLEHLNKVDGHRFLEEAHRIMKKGGLIRIIVPDLNIAIKKFNDGLVDDTLDTFFYTSKFDYFSCHRYLYNYSTLEKKLNEIGFMEIRQCTFQQGECPDIQFLDVYPDFSLYVEARK